VSAETIELCRLFESKYKQKCMSRIARDQRFHTKFYKQVFTGRDFVTWLRRKRLIKSRRQGVELGRKLIAGRVINHVSFNRNFYDNFNFYSFNQSNTHII
jgi:hypothetical protein